jgi:ankyrin repeat protein
MCARQPSFKRQREIYANGVLPPPALGTATRRTFHVNCCPFKPIRESYEMMRPTLLCALLMFVAGPVASQVPPTAAEAAQYTGLLAAAARDDAATITRLSAAGSNVEVRDGHGRTPLHVAAHAKARAAMRSLVAAGANPNALDDDRYDIVTIAAVADDEPTLELALALGCSPRNVTSRYDGTALIAAAHLGHDGVVRTLVHAGAPLDHVNNLGWTALIESIVLGNGGPRHIATMKALIDGGANVNLADRSGATPLTLARSRNFGSMGVLLERAGAH